MNLSHLGEAECVGEAEIPEDVEPLLERPLETPLVIIINHLVIPMILSSRYREMQHSGVLLPSRGSQRGPQTERRPCAKVSQAGGLTHVLRAGGIPCWWKDHLDP